MLKTIPQTKYYRRPILKSKSLVNIRTADNRLKSILGLINFMLANPKNDRNFQIFDKHNVSIATVKAFKNKNMVA